MMYPGLYDVFPFTVAEAEVCTFRDFKLSREIVFAEHKTLDGLSRLRHTGRNLAPASLTVQIVPLARSHPSVFFCALLMRWQGSGRSCRWSSASGITASLC